LGIEEISIYGFTQENIRRPGDQIVAFRRACVDFARGALEREASLLVLGDASSPEFPGELRPYAWERHRAGPLAVNLLVNYGWQWDLQIALRAAASLGTVSRDSARELLASAEVSRIDLIVRWGGHRRLSGFLPVQSVYADFFVIDAYWPDFRLEQFDSALRWYASQDVTLGG
jgi:undecaprenyl diphosphate synthase